MMEKFYPELADKRSYLKQFFRTAAVLFIACSISASAAHAAGPLAEAPAKTTESGEHIILNNQSIFRIQNQFGLVRINSELLKKEGETLFSKRALKRFEKRVKLRHKSKNYDWTKTDWRDVACFYTFTGQAGDDSKVMGMLRPEAPAKGWTKLGFDDSVFDRRPLGYPQPTLDSFTLINRGLYLRTYFNVPDPEDSGDLFLSITYRGGARVFINGQEIARSHLPEGSIDAETYATDYPREAYLAMPDELPARPTWADFIGDIRCSYDNAPFDQKEKDFRFSAGKTSVNRKGWERIRKLRDRARRSILIPKKLLKKGSNVLAIEIRSARYHPIVVPGARAIGKESRNNAYLAAWAGCYNVFPRWTHAKLVDISLTSSTRSVPSCLARPKGLQAWADDMNQWLVEKSYNPVGTPAGTVRFVSGQNGSVSAQIGTGTDRSLTGFKAEVTVLKGPGGSIPVGAMTILYGIGHDLLKMSQLGHQRCLHEMYRQADVGQTLVWRYSDGKQPFGKSVPESHWWTYEYGRQRGEYLKTFRFFDHLSAKAPVTVPAGSCQPVWLRLKVPENAVPGIYKGSVTISATGAEPVTLPIEAEVIGWRVPSPQEFQTIVQSEQSPFGILKHYKVEPWSDAHWKLIESSFKHLARLGNDWVFIPVLMNSEVGNKEHVMVTGIRKKDGSYDFDFSIADKYLALARKVQGDPRMVCFLVMQAAPSKTNAVRILDEATGKTETMEVGPKHASTRGKFWRAFGYAVYQHMKELGLEDSLYFGQCFDQITDKELIGILDQVVPNSAWTTAAHGRAPNQTFRVSARAYGVDVSDKSKLSWKNPYVHLLLPRIAGSVMHVDGISPPFSWRAMPDRALYSGFNGIGRVGADYFDWTWFDGFEGGYWKMVGRSSVMTLWPGTDAVDSSVRNEALIEGVQESDARIYMEQAIDRGVLPKELAEEVQKVLDEHIRSTLHLGRGMRDNHTMDIAQNWQNRTRRLFQTAAKVAAAAGLDVDRSQLGGGGFKITDRRILRDTALVSGARVEVPFLGQTRLEIKLRNWGSKPRDWKATSDQGWIIPEQSSGNVTGHQTLGIILDGSSLKVSEEVSGTLTVTDTALGTAYPVKIDAVVAKALEYQTRQDVKFEAGGGAGGGALEQVHILKDPLFNVPMGKSETRTYYLRNRARSHWNGRLGIPKAGLK